MVVVSAAAASATVSPVSRLLLAWKTGGTTDRESSREGNSESHCFELCFIQRYCGSRRLAVVKWIQALDTNLHIHGLPAVRVTATTALLTHSSFSAVNPSHQGVWL